jgi:hypothetical protein
VKPLSQKRETDFERGIKCETDPNPKRRIERIFNPKKVECEIDFERRIEREPDPDLKE